MVKVLFLHWKLVCGGAEQALFNLVQLMDKSVFDITVFTIHDGGEWDNKFRDAGIRVIHSYSGLKPTSNPVGRIMNHFRLKRIEHCRKNSGRELLETCLEEKYDLVVSYHTQVYCGEAGLSDKFKCIKYIHGNAVTNELLSSQIQMLQSYRKSFDRIICVSDLAKRDFLSVFGNDQNVISCLNPIDSMNVQKRACEPCQISTDVPYICAVGRLSREKGFERLVTIHKRILKQGINHKIVLVGDGPEYDEIHRAIKDSDVENSFIMVGYLENPYPYIQNSQFLVISSHTEGMPVVAMEAICLGIPVVSTYSGVQELFGDEACGIIVPDLDECLYDGILKMLTDDLYYNQTKAAAKRRSSYFDGRQMAQRVERIYMDVLNEKRS